MMDVTQVLRFLDWVNIHCSDRNLIYHYSEYVLDRIQQVSYNKEQLSKMTVVKLKILCKEQNLSYTGKKAALIERLSIPYQNTSIHSGLIPHSDKPLIVSIVNNTYLQPAEAELSIILAFLQVKWQKLHGTKHVDDQFIELEKELKRPDLIKGVFSVLQHVDRINNDYPYEIDRTKSESNQTTLNKNVWLNLLDINV